jgi:CMP-N,N'-diacetyllegionaminic acid synthase
MPDARFVAIIPARGGSTRVPRKNLAPLNGRPLLAYTLDACRDAGLAGHTFVSSDDTEIATVAEACPGVRVIRRPPELATATASTESALLHTLDVLRDEGIDADWAIVLQPTSPLRTGASIRAFRDAVVARVDDQDCLMSITENRGDFWSMRDDGILERLMPNAARRQQDRRPLWEENSAIYVTRVATLRETASVLGHRVRGMPLDPIEALDINTDVDLRIAEALLAAKATHGKTILRANA